MVANDNLMAGFHCQAITHAKRNTYLHLKGVVLTLTDQCLSDLPGTISHAYIYKWYLQMGSPHWIKNFLSTRYRFKRIINTYIHYTVYIIHHKIVKLSSWCQELVGTFLTSRKLFDFNSRKERQILMKFNIK